MKVFGDILRPICKGIEVLRGPVRLRVSPRSLAARDSPVDLELRGDLVFIQGVDQPGDVDLARGSRHSRKDSCDCQAEPNCG